jgi:hypothetical protein
VCRHREITLSWGRRISCETVCADQRAPCWTFGCAALSRGRPDLPSPEPDGTRVHVPLESIPSRVFTSCRPSDPLGPEPTPTRFFAPSTTSPGLAPSAAVRPDPLRFRSQVFSTSQRFPGMPGLRGLVSCRSRPWGSPFGAFLLAGVACASRRRRAPLQFSTGHQFPGLERGLFTPGFTDARASRRGGLDPHRSSDTVSTVRARTPARIPRRPDPARPPGTSDVPASAASKPSSPREAVPRRRRSAAAARCSRGLRPSRAFLRSSLGACVDPADRSVRRALACATTRRATPRRQVRPPRPCDRCDLVGVRPAGRLRIGTCRLSATTLPPSTLERLTVIGRPGSSEV